MTLSSTGDCLMVCECVCVCVSEVVRVCSVCIRVCLCV